MVENKLLTREEIQIEIDKQLRAAVTDYAKQVATLQATLRQERSNNIALEDELQRLRNNSTVGRGELRGHKPGPTPEELRPFAKTRVEIASFEEVISLEAERQGMTVDAYLKQQIANWRQ